MFSKIEPTQIDGCVLITFKEYHDNRGTFTEAYQQEAFKEAGLPTTWAQDNISTSQTGVLRGLHIQRLRPQGKLVRCLSGAIQDVCLDLRQNSPTFMKIHSQNLVTSREALYLPPGTAHGFLALMPNTIVYYKCTSLWHPESDGGVHPFDEELKIPWSRQSLFIMSDKDMRQPKARDWFNEGFQ